MIEAIVVDIRTGTPQRTPRSLLRREGAARAGFDLVPGPGPTGTDVRIRMTTQTLIHHRRSGVIEFTGVIVEQDGYALDETDVIAQGPVVEDLLVEVLHDPTIVVIDGRAIRTRDGIQLLSIVVPNAAAAA